MVWFIDAIRGCYSYYGQDTVKTIVRQHNLKIKILKN